MIYEVSLIYCEINYKYDLWINGVYSGKHYTLLEALKHIELESIRNE